MRLKRHIAIGLATIVVGFLPFIYTNYRYYSHNWTPLTFPFVLKPGVIQTPEFETDNDGTYVIWLAFDTSTNIEREFCHVGWDFPRGACSGIDQTLHLKYSVYRGNQTLVSGQPYKPSGMGGAGEVEVQLGSFEGIRGAKQQISLLILSNGKELNSLHPRVVVEAHRIYWEKWIILGQMALIVALLATVIGIGWIAVSIIIRTRRNSADPSM